jgi:hypothetical protein
MLEYHPIRVPPADGARWLSGPSPIGSKCCSGRKPKGFPSGSSTLPSGPTICTCSSTRLHLPRGFGHEGARENQAVPLGPRRGLRRVRASGRVQGRVELRACRQGRTLLPVHEALFRMRDGESEPDALGDDVALRLRGSARQGPQRQQEHTRRRNETVGRRTDGQPKRSRRAGKSSQGKRGPMKRECRRFGGWECQSRTP